MERQLLDSKGNHIWGSSTNDGLGSSVSISKDGNSISVGLPGGDGNSGTDVGLVKVLDWDINQWNQRGSQC